QPVVVENQPNDNTDPQNIDVDVADAAFDVKQNEKAIHVSLSRSDKPKKHYEKDKRDNKGKSLVDSPTGVRDLRAKFEEFYINSTDRVNAVIAPVTAVGPNSTNSTNSFNTASPSDTIVSPNFGIAGKSSFVDSSKYSDDPDMPELEDIIYSDDEEDVGAEADLSNLERNIYVSPIPTTRVHKDHPVTQIIAKASCHKALRVFNSRTKFVQETLHINILENKPKVAGIGPKWLFDIDTLTQSMNYQPVVVENQPNDNTGERNLK
nr:ribonuclease H-like domain-containing protein [Tanacetum cinerariifolium]